jgi:hypothetical protein
MSKTRFTVSPRAEKFLRTLSERPGLEMGLVLANGFEDKDMDGRITDRHSGTHFYVGWDESGKWCGERVAIAGLGLWISLEVTEALQGKTLTIRPTREQKELLVAV